ncbi:MAG: putative 4-hydroxybenzoate polyprenyltransferase [Bacteroidia bacterium]|nr:putative 4-hydroxybenzoate polyprenyltransferase [Bacteroidia bacterium]
MKNKLRDYTRLVKFEHTIFALPFALIGFFLAVEQQSGGLSFSLLLKVLGCMIFARNAAMGFNRFLDRSFDAANPRTTMREIPAGIVSPKKALIFVIVNSLLFVMISWLINDLCFYLSPIALLVILGYSYTKRITPLCHFILSAGLALAPIGAYLAVTGQFAAAPLLFSMVVFFWVSGFDIIYACQDVDFDRTYELKSIPAMLGIKSALQLSVFVHLIAVVFVISSGFVLNSGWLYWIGAAIFISLLAYQHLIIKPNDLSRVNLAFGTTNGIASVIFAIFVIASLLKSIG